MSNIVTDIWSKISDLGVQPGSEPGVTRTTRTLNRVSFLAALLVAPFMLPAINPTNDFFGWVECVSAIGFLGVLIANAANRHRAAQATLILTTLFKIFFSASSRGIAAGEQLFFIPLMVGMILLFNLRKAPFGLLMWAITLSVWGALEITDYQLLVPHEAHPDPVIRQIFTINFVVTLIIMLAIAFHYSRLADRQQGEILDAMKEAEQASRAKSEFLSVISHELRTPIHAILNYADILEDGTRDPDQLATIYGLRLSSDNLFVMVDNILHVAGTDSGEAIPLTNSEFVPDEPLEKALYPFRSKASEKGLVMNVNCPRSLLTLLSDRDRIRQILMNLIDNAIKFTAKGGITLSCHCVADPDHDGRGMLSYEISDTGPGISPDLQDQIFQPFFMGDTSVSRANSGMGIGLTISKRLVDALGGQLTVSSLPGEGSTFTVRIPVNIVHVHSEPPLSSDMTSNHSQSPEMLKILLVDDHPVNQKVASAMLKKLGHEYRLASNGAQAIEACRSEAFHLVFMDIQMPVLDGIEATRQIRAELPDEQQPVIIALSANTTERDRNACFESGMNDFLAKPVTKNRIEEMIRKWTANMPTLTT